MNEDDLRRALREEAARVEVGDDSWHRLQSRLTNRFAECSPARSMLRPAIGVVLIAAILGGTLVVFRGGSSHRVSSGRTDTLLPSQIVAVTDRSRLVVLDSRSGGVIRTLSLKVATFRFAPELGVSPDGVQIYFTSVDAPPEACATSGIESIFRVPRLGGRPVVVGRGRTVAVNPRDGRLAFSRDYERCAEGPGVLEIAGRGDLNLVPSASNGSKDLESSLYNLSWSSDGGLLSFDWANASTRRPYELDPSTATSMDAATCLCSSPRNLATFGFLGGSHVLLGTVPPGPGLRDRSRVVAVGSGGAIDRTLFRWPFPVSSLESDSSGAHILMTSPAKRRGRSYYDALYRWSRGDKRPTKIRDGIVAAAWIPDAPSRPPPEVAVVGGTGVPRNAVRILDTQDGHEVRRVETGSDPVVGLAATPDGSRVVVATTPAGAPACAGDMTAVDVATGARQRILGEAATPVVNRNGLAAYPISCDGITLGFTDLRSGENSRTNPLADVASEASPRVTMVEPLGWSPDGTRLLYRLRLRGDPTMHYYVGSLWPAVPSRRTKVREIPHARHVVAAAFLDDHRVLLAGAGSRRTDLRTWRIGDRNTPAAAGVSRLGEGVTSLVADRSGRHLLALAGDRLYRFDRDGTGGVRFLAAHVAAAAWLGRSSG